jgi:hypothetical protein
MNFFHFAMPRFALWVCPVLLTACGSPGYNENPSQQMAEAKLGCLAATDFFAIYFRVYVQNTQEASAARIKKPLYRTYCEDIPTPGTVFFTADLVGDALRRTPIGIRVVEQTSGGDESQHVRSHGLRPLLEIPPQAHPNGVIETRIELAKNGHYAIHLIRGGNDAAAEAGKLIIPLHVGAVSGITPLATRLLPLFGIAAAGVLGYWAVRSRRRRKDN